MAAIRPLEPVDLGAVAQLVATCLPGWRRSAEDLGRNLVGHPWAAAPLRSLVATDGDGSIIGVLGAQERRLRFDGEVITGVCCSHLAVAPDRRGGAAGALLVKRLLGGDQAITWTDSGTSDVVRIWRTFGGHLDHARTGDWMYVLRPVRWVRRALASAISRRERGRNVLPAAGIPVQALGRRLVPDSFPALPAEVTGEEATPEAIIEHLPQLTTGLRLRIDYDAAYLAHVHEQIEALAAPVVRQLVYREGNPIGWYVYLPRPTVSRVIHVAADRRQIEPVFTHMAADARARGSAVLAGRLEPHLDEPLRKRLAIISLTQQPLVHARDAALLATIGSSASLLTQLDLVDSEWW